MFKLRKNKKGFTLIELIVVIAILAILAAIAIPSFIGITNSAEAKVALANGRSIVTAINTYNMVDGTTPITYANAESTCGDLWPSGIADDDAAWTYVQLTDGVAALDETGSQSHS